MSTSTESQAVKRRDFLKVLGAGTAVAATVGCGTDHVQKLIPYVQSPDNTVPGVSNYYTSTCRECASACGIISETRDGRSIKLEGNPQHPLNRGALCAKGQAALQGLYNPDRFRGPMMRDGGKLVPTTWEKATQRFNQLLGEARSKGTASSAVFINQHESGSFPAFLDQWLAGFGMPAHLSYDADASLPAIVANRQSYGISWPMLDFNAAKLVVSFGADFLDNWGASVPQQLDWADARAKIEDAPRMIYVGPRRSLTGLNADQWIACRPGTELAIVNALSGKGSIADAATASGVPAATLQQLANEVGATKPSLFLAGGSTANATELALAVNALNQSSGNVGVTVKPATPMSAYDRLDSHADVRAATERMAAGQVGVFMVRGANPAHTMPKALGFAAALARVPVKISFSSYPDETTELCDLVLPDNHALESWGDAQPLPNVMSLQQPVMDPVFDTRATADVLIAAGKADVANAAKYSAAGDYRTWLISRFPGGAPAFTAALPRGIASGSTLQGAAPAAPPTTLRTAPAADSGGDMFLVVYPSPVLGSGAGANKPWLQELPDPVTKICWQSWAEIHPATAKKLGMIDGDLLTVATATGKVTVPMYPYLGIRTDTVALSLGQGHTAYGRYAKNIGINAADLLGGYEDPQSGAHVLSYAKATVSKAGGHEALVTTEGAARQNGRGIAQAVNVGDVGEARSHAKDSGAAVVGGVATNGGRNDEPNHGAAEGGEPGHGNGGPQGAPGARVQGETAHEEGGEEEMPGDASHAFLPGLRSPVANDAQGDFGDPTSKDKGMYDPNHWSGMAKRRWAMTIDLARCTGCSACVTACYSENNIPTVGAPWQGRALRPGTASDDSGWDMRPGSNIVKGREMNWIRLERYYEGAWDAENTFDPDFEARFAPMLCQHCGNAPCEPVCPVYATYHSPDGLNVQVYNRCVGTRYCSNNCPYKVRYFNWFGYGEPDRRQYAFPEPLHMQLNPDVTVRGKGVMEKCSFCVQRIREAEHRAKLEHRELEPDEFTVACAQACPSRAIVFGDAADDRWTVARQVDDRRAYHVFEELNTFTAVVYLKRVNHPAPGAPRATA